MKKLRVKQAYQKVMINYNVNVLTTDYGSFNFDNITFDYSKYNVFQIVKLYINNEVVTTLFFDEKDKGGGLYKDEFAFCNCNRNLECLIARYRKLKGG